jgi:hypothetical protein
MQATKSTSSLDETTRAWRGCRRLYPTSVPPSEADDVEEGIALAEGATYALCSQPRP